PGDLARDSQFGESLGNARLVAPLELRGAGAVGLEAFPAHDQLEPPASPAEFPVGAGFEPDALLHGDHLADAFVFHRAKLRVVVRAEGAGRGLRAEKLLARLLELFRA